MTSLRSRLLRYSFLTLVFAASAFAFANGPADAASPKTKQASVTKDKTDVNRPLSVAVDEGVAVSLAAPASSVFIANPDVADVQVLSPTSLMVFGKKTGETTLMATDEKGTTLIHKRVLVAQDLRPLRTALDAVLPNNKIKIEAVPNGIVLTGTARDASAIEDARRLAARYVPKEGEIINRVHVVGSNQIHIRVRFAEVTRDVDKHLGFDWETIGTMGGANFGIASGSSVVSSGANLLNVARPSTSGTVSDVISFSKLGKTFNINGMIDALSQEGLVTILAEPNLTAMSGETASFLAGGEFPVPVPQSQTSVTIEWKQYGVSLAFTPTLIGNDRINLHVRPEVSQLTDQGAVTLNSVSVPGLTTRRAETTIELASGQSFAIGGLLNNSQTQTIDKYPFLGDVPVLGNLFRSSRFQNNQSELVIIITPYLVKPTDQEQLSMPTDGFSAADDIDFMANRRSINPAPDARTMSGTPRAVIEQTRDEAPAPAPAPSVPVSSDSKAALPAPAAPVAPKAKPAPRPTETQPSPTSIKPSSETGAGGFILE